MPNYNLMRATKFQPVGAQRDLALLRTTALKLFIAMAEDIEQAPNNEAAILKEGASYFNSSALTLDEFRQIFNDQRLLTSFQTNQMLAPVNKHFHLFCQALSLEQNNSLSEGWKAIKSTTLVDAMASLSPEAKTAIDTVLTSLLVIPSRDRDKFMLLNGMIVQLRIDGFRHWHALFKPEVLKQWVEGDCLENQIHKTKVLLEFQWLLTQAQDLKDLYFVVAKLDIYHPDLLIEGAVEILCEAGERWLSGDGGLEANHLVSIVASLPNDLYARIFSHAKLDSWRTQVSSAAAEVLGCFFNKLDQREGKALTSKRLVVEAFLPANHPCRQVLIDYWACTPATVNTNFPIVETGSFLGQLSTRSVDRNLRMFLRILHDITMRANSNTGVSLFQAIINPQEPSRVNRELMTLFVHDNFDIFKIVDSPAVLHLISPTMWYMYNDTLGASISASNVVFQDYVLSKGKGADRYFIQLAQEYNALLEQVEVEAADESLPVERNDEYYFPSFWYDDRDIDKLFELETQARGVRGAGGQRVEVLASFSYADLESFRLYLQSTFDSVGKKFSQEKQYTIVIPLHAHHNHWTGCVLDVNIESKKVTFHFIDPMKRKTNEDVTMTSALQALFSGALRESTQFGKSFSVAHAPVPRVILRQEDLCSCGPMLIENVMRMVYPYNGEAPSTAQAIRLAQVKSMGPAFSRKQRADQLYSQVNRMPTQVRAEFFQLCRQFIAQQDSSELRTNLINLTQLQFALQPTSKPSVLLLNLLKEVFTGISSAMDVEALLDHLETAEFSIGYADVLRMTLALTSAFVQPVAETSAPPAQSQGSVTALSLFTSTMQPKIEELGRHIKALPEACAEGFLESLSTGNEVSETLRAQLELALALVGSEDNDTASTEQTFLKILKIVFDDSSLSASNAGEIYHLIETKKPDVKLLQLLGQKTVSSAPS